MSLSTKRRQPDVLKVFAFDEEVASSIAALFHDTRSPVTCTTKVLEAFQTIDFLKRIPSNTIDEIVSAFEELSADRRAIASTQKTLGKCVGLILRHVADSSDLQTAQRAIDRYRTILKRTVPKTTADEYADSGVRRIEKPVPLRFSMGVIDAFISSKLPGVSSPVRSGAESASDADRKSVVDTVGESLAAVRRVLGASNDQDLLHDVLSNTSGCARVDAESFRTHFPSLVDHLLGVYLDESSTLSSRHHGGGVGQRATSACETIDAFWKMEAIAACWNSHEELVSQLINRCLRDAEAEAREAEALHAGPYRAGAKIEEKLDASYEHLRALAALLDWVGVSWLRSRAAIHGNVMLPRFRDGSVNEDSRVTQALLSRASKKCCWIVLKSLLVRFTFGTAAIGNRLVTTLIEACTRQQFAMLKWQPEVVTRYISVQAHADSSTVDAALRRADAEIDADDEAESIGLTFLRSFLRVVTTYIELNSSRLPVESVRDLIGLSVVPLRRAILRASDRRTFSLVIGVYRALFGSRNVPVIGETYCEVVADLELALNTLLVSAGADRCSLLTESASASPRRSAQSHLEVSDAETIVVVTCALLAELVRTASPIVSLLAPNPPMFTTLTRSGIRSVSLIRSFPRAHAALIGALRALASRHNHFISSSSLCGQSNTTQAMQTSEYLTTILRVIGDLFRIDAAAVSETESDSSAVSLSIDLRSNLIGWLTAIVRAEPAGRVLSSVAFRDAFDAVVTACSSLPAVDARATDGLLQLTLSLLSIDARLRNESSLIAESTLVALVDLACRVISQLRADGDMEESECRRLAFEVLDRVPLHVFETMYKRAFDASLCPNLLTRRVRHEVFARATGAGSQRDATSSNTGQLLVGALSIENFVTLMRFVLLGEQADGEDTRSLTRLRVLFNAVETLQLAKRGCETSVSRVGASGKRRFAVAIETQRVTMAWCVWDTAQFCVATKLKTPLGARPDFLFYAVDGRLRSLANRLASTSASGPEINDCLKPAGVDAHLDAVARGSLLLSIVEQLERAVTNAHAGSAFALPAAPRGVRTFFAANRRVCANWFAQLRPLVIAVAHRLVDNPFAVVHNSFAYLRELDERESEPRRLDDSRADELESVCLYLSAALNRLDAPHHLAALSCWLRSRRLLASVTDSTGRTRYGWLDGFQALAQGSFERAIDAFRSYLASMTGLLPSRFDNTSGTDAERERRRVTFESTRIVCAALSQAYEALGRYDDALENFDELLDTEQSNSLLDGRLSCLQALGRFGQDLETRVPTNERVADGSLCSLIDAVDARMLRSGVFGPSASSGIGGFDSLLDQVDAVRADVREFVTLTSDPDDVQLCSSLKRLALHSRLARLLINGRANPSSLSEFVRDSMRACSLLSRDCQSGRPSKQRVGMLLSTEQCLRLAGSRLESPIDDDSRRRVELAIASQLRRTGNVQSARKRLLTLVSLRGNEQDAVATDAVLAERLHLIADVPMTASTSFDVLNEAAKLLLAAPASAATCGDAQLALLSAVYGVAGRTLRASGPKATDTALSGVLLRTTRYLEVAASRTLVGSTPLRRAVDSVVSWFDSTKRFDWPFSAFSSETGNSTNAVWNDAERTIGKMFATSCLLAPLDAKTFYTLGSFALRVGRRAINRAITTAAREEPSGSAGATSGSRLRPVSAYSAAPNGYIELDLATLGELERCVPSTFPASEFDRLIKILTRVRIVRACPNAVLNSNQNDDDEPELYADEVLVEDDDAVVRAELLAECGTLRYLSDAVVQQLINVRRRVLIDAFHEPLRVATSALFQFLELVADSPSSDVASDKDRSERKGFSSPARSIRAALRLLRVLARHRSKMPTLLDSGFAHVPTSAYRPLVPQLFARLVHPDAAVRRCVAELLGRIGAADPHAIVFPALVGASASRRSSPTEEPHTQNALPGSGPVTGAGESDSAADEIETVSESQAETDEDEDDEEAEADADANRVAELLGEANANNTSANAPLDSESKAARRKRRHKREKRARAGGARVAQAHSHYALLVDALRRDDSSLVSQVRVLIGELHRVTMLFEEIWLNALAHAVADCEARSRRFAAECEKAAVRARQRLHTTDRDTEREAADRNDEDTTDADADVAAENTRWLLEKHSAVHNSTVFLLERLARRTVAREPETPFEARFCAAFRSAITETIRAIREPSNEHVARSTSLLFGNLYHSIQEYAHKHAAGAYELASVSPRLAALRDTRVPIPGASRGVTLRGVDRTVQTIMTRTRPKRFALIGNDGTRHVFLFKGLDDLHTDERCMQLLTLVNRFLAEPSAQMPDALGSPRLRVYPVTPTGARSGLIRYVDGVHSLFSIYKRWQVREAQAQAQAQTATSTARDPPVAVPSPSELFNTKLRHVAATRFDGALNSNYVFPPAALTAGNVKIDRRRCGVPVLRAVHEALAADTPRDLLAVELLATATCVRDAVRGASQLARSTAAASAAGWLVGLGDRHPDNLLVDLERAELVHIDYSVVLERGHFLKVPERVPFRLTRTLQRALACDTLSSVSSENTSHDGPFRRALVHMLTTMRDAERRETLLLLFEAFLLDPLVDWGSHYLEHVKARRKRARVRAATRRDASRPLDDDALSGEDAASETEGNTRRPQSDSSGSSSDSDDDEDHERASRPGRVGDVLSRAERRRLVATTHWRLLVANSREATADWQRDGASLLNATRNLLVIGRERLATAAARRGARERLAALNAACSYLADDRFSDAVSRASLPQRAVAYRAAAHDYQAALAGLRKRRDDAVEWTGNFNSLLHHLARFDFSIDSQTDAIADAEIGADCSLEQLAVLVRAPLAPAESPADRVSLVLPDAGQSAADQLREASELHAQLISSIDNQRQLVADCLRLFVAYARAVAHAQPSDRLLRSCRVAALAAELHEVSLLVDCDSDNGSSSLDESRLTTARDHYATRFVAVVELRAATENAAKTIREYETELRELLKINEKLQSSVPGILPHLAPAPFEHAQREAARNEMVTRVSSAMTQYTGVLGLSPQHADTALTLTVFWTVVAAVPSLLDELNRLTLSDDQASFRMGESLVNASASGSGGAIERALAKTSSSAELCSQMDAALRRMAALSSAFDSLALLGHILDVNCAPLFDATHRAGLSPATPTSAPSVGRESVADALVTLCGAMRSLVDRVGDHMMTFSRQIVPAVTARIGSLNDELFAETRRRIDEAHLETRLRHLDDVCADKLDTLIFADSAKARSIGAAASEQDEAATTISRLIRELTVEFDSLFESNPADTKTNAARSQLKTVWNSYADSMQQLAVPFENVTRAIESLIRVAQRDEAASGFQPTDLGLFVATAFAKRDAFRDAFAVRALAARWRFLDALGSFYAARCDAFDAARLLNDTSVAVCVLDTVSSILDRLALPLGNIVMCYAEQCLLNRDAQRYAPQAQILVLLAPGDPDVLNCYRESLDYEPERDRSSPLRVPLGIYNASSTHELARFADMMVQTHLAALAPDTRHQELVCSLGAALEEARFASNTRRTLTVTDMSSELVRHCAARLRRTVTALRFVHSDIPQLAATRLDENAEFSPLFIADAEADPLSRSLGSVSVENHSRRPEVERAALLSELKQMVQVLAVSNESLQEITNSIIPTDSAIARRVKWASGSNPRLRSVLAEFDSMVAARDRLVSSHRRAAQRCADLGRALLFFEMFRTRTSDAVNYDRSVLADLDACATATRQFTATRNSVTSRELAVVEDFQLPQAIVDFVLRRQSVESSGQRSVSSSYPAELEDETAYIRAVDEWWTQSFVEATQRIANIHAELNEGATRTAELRAIAALREATAEWRAAYTRLRALIDRFREHITVLARFEHTTGLVPLRRVLRGDSDWPVPVTFAELKRLVRRSDLACRDALLCANQLAAADVDSVTNASVNAAELCDRLVSNVEHTERCVSLLVPLIPRLTAHSSASAELLPAVDPTAAPNDADAESQQWRQRLSAALATDSERHSDRANRDVHAISKSAIAHSEVDVRPLPASVEKFSQQCEFIWRRLIGKLDGRKSDGTRISAEEQADRLIREATNEDNLALMYEGWIPWL